MNVQLKKGVLEMIVLNEIKLSDKYGYELSQNISEFLSIADGTLYPMLRRLVKDEYLDTYLGKASGGPARKYYALTPKGEIHLENLRKEWMSLQKSVDKFLGKGEKG